MKLYYPLKNFTFTQRFGENANSYYAEGGLMGHPGDDMVSFYDDLISFATKGDVYKIINKDDKDLNKFRAVFQLVDDGNKHYELCYGHCNLIHAIEGIVDAGDDVGTEGNTGDVASNGKKITSAQKANGSRAGTHLHFQVREVEKVKEIKKGKIYLTKGSGKYKDKNGNYYLVPNHNNGYNGCVNPAPFYNGKYARDIKVNLMTQLLDLSNKVLKFVKK